jgi:ketosteroid isomerase-like protein
MKKTLAVAATVVASAFLTTGCGGGSGALERQVAQWEAELMAADEAFAATIETEGLSRWGSFFSEDAAVVQQGVGEITGVENIQARMDGVANAVSLFTWAPDRASVSAGGDLGYTVGRYRTRTMTPDGIELESTGIYVSIWRRQDDGSWKVEMDLGNPLTEPTPVSDPGAEAAGGDAGR